MSNATMDLPLVAIAKVTVGPILMGTFMNLVLFGVSVAQFYFYVQSYKKDRLWMKCMIIGLFFIDLLNSIFLMIASYDALINSFGQEKAVTTASWLISTDPFLTAIIGVTVQCFFAWRVKVLTRNWLIAGGLMLLSMIATGGGIAVGVAIAAQVHIYVEFQKFNIQVIVWLVGSVLCDCSITAVLVWHLRTHKTGMNNSDDIVDKIIRLTVQTGMITSVWAIVDLAIYLRYTEGYHIALNFTLAKLYTNSLLSSLNSRSGWAFGSSSDPSGHPSSGRGRRGTENISLGTRTQVFVNVESHAITDSQNGFDETKSGQAGDDLSAHTPDYKLDRLTAS